MSDEPLPEDISLWPSDPYRLLGVPHQIDERSLKRAYLNLIKKYKPEHAPHAFQKIRAAYETIQERIKYSHRWNTFTPEQDDTETDTGEPRQQRESIDDSLTDYPRLASDFETNPGANNLHLKLYWLLVATPSLDPKRKPIEWLYRGLTALRGRCFPSLELVRRALDSNPTLAFGDLAQALIGPDMDPMFVRSFVTFRWRAARSLGFWNVIRADVHSLRPRSHRELEEVWPVILITAARQMVWSDEPEFGTVRDCMREVEHWGMQHHGTEEVLLELDLTMELAEARRSLGNSYELASILSQILPSLGDTGGSKLDWLVRPLLNALVRDLPETLGFLDRLAHSQPEVFIQLARVIDQLRVDSVDSRSPNVLQLPIRNFLSSIDWSSYGATRPALVRFCLNEAIDPAQLAACLSDASLFAQPINDALAPMVANDWPLKYTVRAWSIVRQSLV